MCLQNDHRLRLVSEKFLLTKSKAKHLFSIIILYCHGSQNYFYFSSFNIHTWNQSLVNFKNLEHTFISVYDCPSMVCESPEIVCQSVVLHVCIFPERLSITFIDFYKRSMTQRRIEISTLLPKIHKIMKLSGMKYL